jgi:hypothetical protein
MWRQLYSHCSISDPPSIVPFTFGDEAVNEGEFVQVTCNVKRGDEPLKISWSLKGDVISSEPEITTTMIGTRTSILIISSAGYRHSGQYTCKAENKAGTDHYSTTLKVNGDFRLEVTDGTEGLLHSLHRTAGNRPFLLSVRHRR